MTATAVETAALFAHMEPLPGQTMLRPEYRGPDTYTLGRLGQYGVIHVETGMGSVGARAAQLTVSDAISHWKPKFVLMVGIAFGKDSQSQAIGDILVGTQIVPYEVQRVGESETIPRGDRPPASAFLVNRFVSQRNWHFEVAPERRALIHEGPLLSGNTLLDNLAERDRLLKLFPTAVGGEMEGAGVCAACHRSGTPWILVKAVCDYADGQKGVQKRERQELAAKSAANLCSHLFSQKGVFHDLNCPTCEEPEQERIVIPTDQELVLFARYKKECEPYYVTRPLDEDIGTWLKTRHVWLFGESGSGKTCSLVRGGIVCGLQVILLDLSTAIGERPRDIVHTALTKLQDINGEASGKKASTLPQAVDAFATYLLKTPLAKTLILIDEVPLSEGAELNAFARSIVALAGALGDIPAPTRPFFAVSTISSPLNTAAASGNKMHEYIQPLNLSRWTAESLTTLVERAAVALRLSLDQATIATIVDASRGSPRLAKNILGTHVRTLGLSGWGIARAIESCTQ